MNDLLIDRLKDSLNADGYVHLPGFLSPDAVRDLRGRVEGFVATAVPRLPAGQAMYEDAADAATLKQVFGLENHDPAFADLLRAGPFRHLAEALLDDAVVPKILEYFNKPPRAASGRVGKPTPPHQDNFYFMLDPPLALTMWLALEDVDEETGCVRYVRGSHRGGLRPHGRTQTLGFSQAITDFGTPADQAAAVAFPARAGDLLVHHAMTVHWAEGNRSPDRSRRALGFIYFAESARENREAKAAYQQQLRAEQLA